LQRKQNDAMLLMYLVELVLDDLCEALRLAGVFDVRQVAFAQVETNGKLSVLQNALDQPVTVRQAGMKTVEVQPFFTLIADGILCPEGLEQTGKSQVWLEKIVKASGAENFREIFLLCANQRGDIICARKER
jgi:uncharacterized membrane protein YcaP (DUF421 family)